MSKKKGLFSWFSKKPAKKTEQEEQEILAQEKEIEAERSEAELQIELQAKLTEEIAAKAQVEADLQTSLADELALKKQAKIDLQTQQAAKLAAEIATKEQAETEAKNAAALAAKEQAELEAQIAAELVIKEQAELEAQIAAELVIKEQAQAEAKIAAELAAKEKAALEAQIAAELAAKEQAELDAQIAAESAAKEKAALEAQIASELAIKKKAELDAQIASELAAKEAAELEAKTAARNAYQEAQRNAELARQQVELDEVVETTEVEDPESNKTDLTISAEDQKLGFFARFAQGLKKTRLSIGSGLLSLFKGKKIDDELFEELEEQLIIADIGVETTLRIIDNLTDHADRKQLKDAEALYDLLKKDLSDILEEVEQPLVIDKTKKPYVILMVGVNGVGKTTTIGKLAKKYQNEGKSVMLAAGDTFRAAAVEQLQVWGERNDIPVIAQQTGADSASVLFDAMDAAQARGIEVLIADTAGRLQNKDHLMGELAKIVRIMRKKDMTAPHEIMLTIDAGTGQNAISQVKLFNEAVGLTGITFTKLDGTAKGGIIFSIADQFKLPIRYIGVGEGIDDLRQFNAKEFIDALFTKEEDA